MLWAIPSVSAPFAIVLSRVLWNNELVQINKMDKPIVGTFNPSPTEPGYALPSQTV